MIKERIAQILTSFKNKKWLWLYIIILLLFLPLTVILAGQQQIRGTQAAAIPLTIDIQTGKNQSTPAGTITSPKFSTNGGNELIVVFLTSTGSNTVSESFTSVTGAGLTFTLARRANLQKGTAEIWYAYSPNRLTNAQIVAARQNGSYQGLMRVVTFMGANQTIGATAAGSGKGLPSVSLTTTVAGSLVLGVGNDPTSSLVHTVGPNQKLTQSYRVTGINQSFWTQQQSVTNPTAGATVILDNTTPTADSWNMAAIEVIPASEQTTSPTPSQPSLLGLVADYSFDEATGTVTVDSSGNGNNGAVINGSWISGKYGNSLSFDGISSQVVVNDSASLDLTGSFTFTAWVNAATLTNYQTILIKEGNGASCGYWLQTNNSYISAGFNPGTGCREHQAAANLQPNTWYHIAAVFDDSADTFKIYLNGNQLVSQTETGVPVANAAPLYLGTTASGEKWKGLLDEVHMYNRALSQTDIQTDMSGVSGTGSVPTVSQPTPTVTVATPTISVPPPTTQPTTTGCSSTSNVPGGRDPWGGCFPGPNNTGVPAGTTLTTYNGCSNGETVITTDNTLIDSKTVNCNIAVRAKGVIIKNSVINGQINTPETTAYSFTLQDSKVNAGVIQEAAIGTTNMTIIRSNITGGITSIYCYAHCHIRDTYVHAQGLISNQDWHLGAIMTNDNDANDDINGSISDTAGAPTDLVVTHNTIACDTLTNSVGGGCSGGLNLFSDFGAIRNVTADSNLIVASTSQSYCTYGASGAKPGTFYAAAGYITYKNNIFQRGNNGKCGAYGPVSGYDINATGNVWTNNKWDDGTLVAPEN